MTAKEFEYIKLMFQLHILNREGKSADEVCDKMEALWVEHNEEFNHQMADISSWCYALENENPEVQAKYRRYLFEGVW